MTTQKFCIAVRRSSNLQEVLENKTGEITVMLVNSGEIPQDWIELRTIPLMTTRPEQDVGDIQVMDGRYNPSADPTLSYMDYLACDVFKKIRAVDAAVWMGNVSRNSTTSLPNVYRLRYSALRDLFAEMCVNHFTKVFHRSVIDSIPVSQAHSPQLCAVAKEFEAMESKDHITVPTWWTMEPVEFKRHLKEQNEMMAKDGWCYQFVAVPLNTYTQGWK